MGRSLLTRAVLTRAMQHLSGMRIVIFTSAALCVLLAPTGASAFCQTTVCDERYSCEENPEMCCVRDANGCDTNTRPITWPTSCVSYNVHEDGSKKRDISAGKLADVLDDVFAQWVEATCDEGSVSLSVEYRGKAECGEPEYNQGKRDRNANVWMFRDHGTKTGMNAQQGSTLSDAALAVTTVSFNEKNAEIYDVDVELLSAIADFTTSDEDVVVDLQAVVTHEAGHFLGLDHSNHLGATMASGYVLGRTDTRDLSVDDISGICEAYPEGRNFPGGRTCEPRGKYSPKCDRKGCGCSQVGTDEPVPFGWIWALALGFGVHLRRRFS
jgi:MYXO-CTERM domain-containing protein